jgi:hypothetical protein
VKKKKRRIEQGTCEASQVGARAKRTGAAAVDRFNFSLKNG